MNKVSLNSKFSLVEILLSVLIFAAAGIIMLTCFGIARYTQIRANDKAKAGAIIQSDFEIIKSLKSAEEMYEFLDSSYESKEPGNTFSYSKYYDENWKQGNDRYYTIALVISRENCISGDLVSIRISAVKESPYPFIKKDSREIYSIETRKFFLSHGGAYE